MKNGSSATVKTGEKMNFKIRKTIKRIAAITTGAALLGATMLGAGLAAEVSITPTEDAEVTTLLAAGGEATGTTDTGQSLIILGGEIANTSVDGIDNPLEDDDVSTLGDDEITIAGSSYNYHEEFNLTSNGPMIGTSLTEKDDDFGIDPYMILDVKNVISYYYVFDETINMSSATASNDAELTFLDKPLTITSVTDYDTFVAEVGERYTMGAGDKETINGHVVELITFSATAAQLDIDGKTISIDITASKNPYTDLEIYFDSAISRTELDESVATFVMGQDAVETINDGDTFRGGDNDICNNDIEDMDCWAWEVDGLNTSDVGDALDGYSGGKITIGVMSNYVVDDFVDDPITVGGSYRVADSNYYFNLVKTVPAIDKDSDDYAKLTISISDSEDISHVSETTFTSERGIVIEIDEDEGLTEEESGNSYKTDKIFLHINRSEGESATEPMVYYYHDDDNNWRTAGAMDLNLTSKTLADEQFASVRFGDTKSTNVNLSFYNTNTTGTGAWIHFDIVDDESYIPVGTDDFWLNVNWSSHPDNATAWAFNSIGNTSGDAETNDLKWGSSEYGGSATAIGTKKVDVLTRYGIIIENPDTNIDNEKLVLYIPNDNVKAKVSVSYGTAGAGYDVKTYSEAVNPILYVGGPAVHPDVRAEHGWGSDPVYGAAVAAKGGAWASFAAGCYYVDANEAWGWSAADSVTAVKAWLAGTRDGKVHC